MIRYSSTTVDKRWDGKQVYKTTQYPTITPSSTDILYVASDSDYLDQLAFRFYKDSTLWWIIAMVNNVGKGRLSIEPGTQLRIPTDINRILSEFNQLNS